MTFIPDNQEDAALLDNAGPWQFFNTPGKEPKRPAFPPPSQWREGWPEAWGLSALAGAGMFWALLSVSLPFAIACLALGILFVPGMEKVWSYGRHKKALEAYAGRDTPLWRIHEERAHKGIIELSKEHSTFAVDVDDQGQNEKYRLLEYRLAEDGKSKVTYRVLVEEDVSKDLLVAVERGAELAEIARRLEEQAIKASQLGSDAKHIEEMIAKDAQLEAKADERTRKEAIRSAVGRSQR